jgi:glucose/arabinose dehydrogenase
VRGFGGNIIAAEEFAHPLLQFAFSPDYNFLYVNFGSKTDSCVKNRSLGKNGKELCNENSGATPFASVRRYSLNEKFEVIPNSGIVFAKGLRNSIALVVHSSGLVLQGENSRDLADSEQPGEELNILRLSGNSSALHYGWPYCYNNGGSNVAMPEFMTREAECKDGSFIPPTFVLPAHSAPLGLTYLRGSKLTGLRSKLLVSLHGYATHGHRIVAIPVDETGGPEAGAPLEDIVFNWGRTSNINPLGAPTGLLEWSDGSVIVLDDKNGAILRLSAGKSVNKLDYVQNIAEIQITDAMVERFRSSHRILEKKCSACHSEFSKDPKKTLENLVESGKLNPAGVDESSLLIKIRYKEMPPKTVDSTVFPSLTPAERKLLLKDLLKVL